MLKNCIEGVEKNERLGKLAMTSQDAWFVAKRVKFCDRVEIKEFHKEEHELEEPEWMRELEEPGVVKLGVTCLFCLTATVILPWYIFGSNY